MIMSLKSFIVIALLSALTNACAQKSIEEKTIVAAPPTIVERKTNPAADEAEQIDYSNRIIDTKFEEDLLSPIKRFTDQQSGAAPEAGKSRLICRGKKVKKQMTGVWNCKNISGKKVLSLGFRKNKKFGWAREWDDHGKLKAESWWINDLLAKPARTFQGAGKKHIWGGFKDDLRNGYFTKFDASGIKLAEVSYKDGKRSGRTQIFYPNKKLKLRLFYVNDEANGEYWSWHENGAIKSHGFMKSGQPTGSWDYWDKTGQKLEASI